jgi:hypothetical protein
MRENTSRLALMVNVTTLVGVKPVNGSHALMYFVQVFMERLHGCLGTRIRKYARRGK